MPSWLWALACDSLIVSIALPAVLSARHAIPLTILFSICDAAASCMGAQVGIQIPISGMMAPFLLALWGGLLLLNLPLIVQWCCSPCWAYLLPPLLALDNLVVPSGAPIAAGFASSVMSALGFALGFSLFRFSDLRQRGHRLLGVPLVLAGVLLWM
jgi:hypothetical protein